MSCLLEIFSIKFLRKYLGRGVLSDLFYLLLSQIQLGLTGNNTHFILQEEFEDTKGVIIIRISKNRLHNGQMKKIQKDKQRSTKHIYITKDRVPRTPLKTGGEPRYPGRVCSFCFTSGTRRVNLVTNPVINHEERTGRCLCQVEHIRGHL